MRHRSSLARLAAALLMVVVPAMPAAADSLPACTETGMASYYGPGFHGRMTASGEIFDSAAMTAAHKTLPLGTEVVVENEDGESVEVTINDRGPFVDGRIIDLSEGAAEALGMVEDGVVPVTVEVYLEEQDDPEVRQALAADAGLPLRRPSLLRLATLGGDDTRIGITCETTTAMLPSIVPPAPGAFR